MPQVAVVVPVVVALVMIVVLVAVDATQFSVYRETSGKHITDIGFQIFGVHCCSN